MTTERSIFDDFAQRLNLGIASIKEQMERTFGPQGSSVPTAVKKQIDDQIFMSVILDSLEREKEEIMAAKRLVAERWAAADEQTPTTVNIEQPKAAVEKKAAPTPGYIEVLIKRIQNLLRKLDAIIEFYDQQSQHLTQQQEVIMEQVVLPALEQLRPVPAIPIIHTLSDGRDIVLNPHMDAAFDNFREEVVSRPEAIHSEQEFDEVFDHAVDRTEIQAPQLARERKSYPFELEVEDKLSVKSSMKDTWRHHPLYKDSYAGARKAAVDGLSIHQTIDLLKRLLHSQREPFQSARDQLANGLSIPRLVPGLTRIVEETEEACEIAARHAKSLGELIATSIPSLSFDQGGDMNQSPFLNNWPPKFTRGQ